MYLADSQAGSTAVGIVVWLVLIVLYWSPFMTGAIMRKHNLGVIFVLTFFGGFVFTWIWAWVKVAEKPQQPVIVGGMWPPSPGWPPYGPPPPGFGPPPVQPPSPQPQAKTDEWYR